MKENSSIRLNKNGLSKVVYIIVAVIFFAVIALFFVGNSDPCGNSACHPDKGETCKSCPSDCGPCGEGAVCGDGSCSLGEDNSVCPSDCAPADMCGDNACGPSENCVDCALDCICGSSQYCSPALKMCAQRPCGDGRCDEGIGEDCRSCSADCGECPGTSACGDGRCDSKETFLGCPSDCEDFCGNGVCGPEENCWVCPQDCKCADGEFCSPEQKRCTNPVCGNQICEIFENSANCCIDCPCEISYTKCNTETRSCESPPTNLGDEEIMIIVADYYRAKSIQVDTITPKEVYVWGTKVGRKADVKISGQAALKCVLVTDAKEVVELPFF